MKPKIAIDITSSQDQFAYRGIGTSTRNLISTLLRLYGNKYEWHLIGYGSYTQLSDNIPLATTAKLKNRTVIFHSLGRLKLSTPFNLLRWHTQFLPVINKVNPDIYFTMEFQRGFPISSPAVVYIHDVIPVVTNSYSPQNKFFNWIKGHIYRYQLNRIRHATQILTNSEFSKTEICKVVDIDSDQVETVHLAAPIRKLNESAEQQVLSKFDLNTHKSTRGYLLNTGGFQSNKNPKLLVRSFAKILEQIPDLQLAIVGKMYKRQSGKSTPVTIEAKAIDRLIDELDREKPDLGIDRKIIRTGFLNDSELQLLTKNATASIYLSSYEGFGLPAIESMAVGTPVIVPHSSCFPEVTGGTALFVELNQNDIIRGTVGLLTDNNTHSRLSKQGQDYVKKYTWEQTAHNVMNSFSRILDGNSNK